jgi:hypothetical protein
VSALFDDPSDFPYIYGFSISAHWTDNRVEDVRRVLSDPRLEFADLAYGLSSLPLLIAQLECLLDRISRCPQSVEHAGLLCVEPGPESDDDRFPEVEELVLQLIETGEAGVSSIYAPKPFIFLEEDGRNELVHAILADDKLKIGDFALELFDLEEDGPPEGTEEHLNRNFDRGSALEGALLAIIAPARILLFAQKASTRAGLSSTSKPGAVVTRLPFEVLRLIFHELSYIVADELVMDDPLRKSIEEPLDARPSRREIDDIIVFASDLGTVYRERRHAWQFRLIAERRRAMLQQREQHKDGAR